MAERLTSLSVELFFNDRKLYDIAVYSCIEKWSSSESYAARIKEILALIIVEGREAGEFERKTPLDETCRSIAGAMQPFVSPLMLQRSEARRVGQAYVSTCRSRWSQDH